jgi:hypothetical protein
MGKIIETLKGGKAVVRCTCGSTRTVCIYYARKNPDARCQKCTGPENARKQQAPKHKGVGDISRRLYDYLRRSAKRRNLVFELTIEDLWELFIQQNRKCAFTGIELNFARGTHKGVNHKAMTASLDRKDSTKGYVKGNVQWVHKRINQLKWKFDEEVFIYWCRKVAYANPEPSSMNDIKVIEKVQRLTGEESTDKPDTSARHPG